jgi:hypothetical protein
MQKRVQERKQTHKKSHTSPSLCSPLFFSSHHRILKHSKTKTPSNSLKHNLKTTPERKKERKKEKRKHKTRTSEGLRRLTKEAQTASLKFEDAEEDTTPMPK